MAYNDGNPGATPVEAGQAPAPSASWWQPSAPLEQQRRRFGWAKALVALIVVAALVAGGLGVRAYLHRSSVTSNQAAVRRAYLGWWSARQRAYLQLDPSGLKALMTPAGYQQEAAQVRQQAATGDPFRLVADHNLQVAVYSGSPYASVDDVWADHSVSLDPTTRQPVQPDPDITIEDSATLKLVGGHWLVGDVYRFGVSRSVPGQTLSYAAASAGVPPPERIRGPLERDFSNFTTSLSTALATSSSSKLAVVSTGPELSQIESSIANDEAARKTLISKGQDNARIALQDSQTAWVYDSYLSSYHYVSTKSANQIGMHHLSTGHVTYRLIKEPSGWKVNYSVGS